MTTLRQKLYETIVTAIASGGALATNTREISGALGSDATTAAHLMGDWELVATWATAPTLDTFVDLYLVIAADGTNYQDGDATIRPPASAFKGSFQVRNVTTSQRMTVPDIIFPPGLYKAIVWNNSGQTMSAAWTLKVRPHSLENV